MTAHALVGDREKSLEAGMNDHVTKPIDPEELMRTLSQWLPPREDVAPPKSAKAAASDESPEAMPDLPGVDTTRGLFRLRGNGKLYRKLLKDFAQDSGILMDKLAVDASAERFDACRGVAHNLKGVAGNIGAERLHQALARLEQSLLGGQGDLHVRLEDAVREAHRVTDGIHNAYPPEAETELSAADQDRLESSGVRAMMSDLETLLGLLERHDIDAQKLFLSLRDKLEEHAPSQARDLARRIDHFDFTSAGDILRKLLGQCREGSCPGDGPGPTE
jgi:HPt (histidine-containing phosphotransfer) domain-containing protein